MMGRWTSLICGLAVATCGCGGSGAFDIKGSDTKPGTLNRVLGGNDVGRSDRAVIVAIVPGAKPSMAVYDIAQGKRLWSVATSELSTRAVVAGNVVSYAAKGAVVGHSLSDGAVAWRRDTEGAVIGITGDRDRVYWIAQGQDGTRTITAVAASSGDVLWTDSSRSRMGQPAARGGLLFVPFLSQWLAVLDGATGKPLARVRGQDHEIAWVRAEADGVTFGSQSGIYQLDAKASPARADQSHFVAAKLPEELAAAQYYYDGYQPVQAGYSAYDRNDRILWFPLSGPDFRFAGESVAVHVYRYLLGYSVTGELLWAYSHPRVDLVACERRPTFIGCLSARGEWLVLDAESGALVSKTDTGMSARSATIELGNWRPETSGDASKPDTRAVLTAIASDKDRRFSRIKRLAIAALGSRQGGDVVGDLLAILDDENAPADVYDRAVKTLVNRADPASLPALAAALAVAADYATGVNARSIGVVAQAIAALSGLALDPAPRKKATEALIEKLGNPATPHSDLESVIRALAVIGGPGEMRIVASFLLMHRSDPQFARRSEPMDAAIDALLGDADARSRSVVAFVAGQSSTVEEVAKYATRALEATQVPPRNRSAK